MKIPKQGRTGSGSTTTGSLPPVKQKRVTDYWLAYYAHPTLHLCSLCGNSGIIDTTKTAISAAGMNAGMRNFCICPNGQEMRNAATHAPGANEKPLK